MIHGKLKVGKEQGAVEGALVPGRSCWTSRRARILLLGGSGGRGEVGLEEAQKLPFIVSAGDPWRSCPS